MQEDEMVELLQSLCASDKYTVERGSCPTQVGDYSVVLRPTETNTQFSRFRFMSKHDAGRTTMVLEPNIRPGDVDPTKIVLLQRVKQANGKLETVEASEAEKRMILDKMSGL